MPQVGVLILTVSRTFPRGNLRVFSQRVQTVSALRNRIENGGESQ